MLCVEYIKNEGVIPTFPLSFNEEESVILSFRKEGAEYIWALIVFIFLAIFPSAGRANPDSFPGEYGEAIYRCNPTGSSRLFIIGMSHRDSLTGSNGSHTAKIQAEVYKLGEWLIRQEGVELFLPEGFFKNPAIITQSNPGLPKAGRKSFSEPLDLKTLEGKLSDRRSFTNAEILLKNRYPIVLQQVEDKQCYDEVGRWIRKLTNCDYLSDEYCQTKAELDYLQEIRTAVMLQKIPGLMSKEYEEGRIKNPRAIFTIGLSHIPLILKSLQESKIRVTAPAPTQNKRGDYVADLLLQGNKTQVSIFIPRSLFEDKNLLRLNNLN
jgi:hypothetical protein